MQSRCVAARDPRGLVPVLNSTDGGNRLITPELGGHKYAMVCGYREFSISPGRFRYSIHNGNVVTYKCFPHYWRFVRGIHLWSVDSPLKGPLMQSFSASLLFLNKLLKIWETMMLMRHQRNWSCEIFLCATHVLCSMSVVVHHYNGVIMGTIASQITSLTIVYSIVYSDADQRKHQSSASLAFVRGIHRGPVNSPHKWPVARKMFPFDDVIMHNDVTDRVVARVAWIRKWCWYCVMCLPWIYQGFASASHN